MVVLTTPWRSALVGLLVVALAPAHGAGTVTGGGVTLAVDTAGMVQEVRVGKDALPCRPAPILSLCDVTRGTDFVPGAVTSGDLSSGLRVSFEGLAARATLKAEPRDGVLHFTCELVGDRPAPARGVLLRFSLPIDCVGWKWHDDMQTARTIGPSDTCENVQALRAWPDLPEWTDKANLRIGAANRNFCTVVTGPVGLCLAPDIERPVIFRTVYDAPARQLQLVYDLALSPDTRAPNRWTFPFDLYASNPTWGFRAALQKYYEIYPHLFKNHVPDPGQWMAFTDLKHIDNANEFHFGLQEGARDPAYDDKIGVLDCTYFTHAGQFVRIPNHDPEKDPAPPFDVILAETEKTFERNTKLNGVYSRVGLHDANGQFQIPKTRVYGHYIAQFNLDPDLPYGRWHLDRTAKQIADFAARDGVLDGFYYDGLTTGLNYRLDHFRDSTAPPLWDPAAARPVLNNFFSSCEFARAAAELLRPQGKITMMNGALGATFYVAPWLDVFGSETGLRIGRSSFNFIRSIIHHKPMMTLLKGNYEQKIGYDEMELFMKRALAYGVFPGFFDWPPSGLGPGGRYWAHPKYYERDRDLFRKYLPLVKTLAAAGWEPVTHARSTNEKVFVERYGPDADGILWLTLLNEEREPQRTTVTVDTSALGMGATQVGCVDVVNGGQLALTSQDGRLQGEIQLAADGVSMLQIASPDRAASWRLRWAQDAVERGIAMGQADGARAKPPLAVHWRADGRFYGRAQVDDENALVLQGNARAGVSASQWAMCFQPEAGPVTLRVRASASALTGPAQIGCRIAWVTPSFSHYEWRQLKLDEGTYQMRDFELKIEAAQPLRAIFVQPSIGKGTDGVVTISSITLTDAAGTQYVVDPTFEQWYEPVPEPMRARLASDSRALVGALAAARQAAMAGVRTDQSRDAILRAGAMARSVHDWIREASAENGCRRVLRDIETAESQLSVALMGALGIAEPRLDGPARAAPGDDVRLRLVMETPRGLGVTTDVAAEAGVAVRRLNDGARVTIPADATPGTVLTIVGTVSIDAGDGRAVVRAMHDIAVARPLEVVMRTAGADPETGAFRIRARVRNNRTRRVRATVTVTSPGGWSQPKTKKLAVAAGESVGVDMVVSPTDQAVPGAATMSLTATADGHSARATQRLLYIPTSANLLRDPGFEQGPWAGGQQDTEVAHSGSASLRLHNPTTASSQALQTVTLNQERPCPILVRCASRAQDVSGGKGRGYCLYIDIYYTDGTPLYGQTYAFDTGTTDWQMGEKIIEPEKPIRLVNVYLLLRGKSGTAWFDDVAVMEDPRRNGNIARDAEVTVDSQFGGYSAVPLNDGIVHVPEDAHWTAESWASADAEGEHSIELAFAQVRTVARTVVYWSLDNGIPKTSQEVRLQIPDGDEWRTVMTVTPSGLEEETVLELPTAVETRRLRVMQPNGRGPQARSYIMWVREVEVFEAE